MKSDTLRKGLYFKSKIPGHNGYRAVYQNETENRGVQ